MGRFRYQIRHTGVRRLAFGIQTSDLLGSGYNIIFGRLFLAVRENRERTKRPLIFPELNANKPLKKEPLVNLAFGRSMLRYGKRIRKENKLWKLQNDR